MRGTLVLLGFAATVGCGASAAKPLIDAAGSTDAVAPIDAVVVADAVMPGEVDAALHLDASHGDAQTHSDAAIADGPLPSNPDAAVVADGASTGGTLSGVVSSQPGPVANARVTLMNASRFEEVRSSAAGAYGFASVPGGTYTLAVAAVGSEYQEVTITVAGQSVQRDFQLAPETHPGAWNIVGDTLPETFGGTNSGTLTAEAGVVACHDTINPLFFDPAASDLNASKSVCQPSLDPFECQLDENEQPLEPESVREQGCHNVALLADGRILFVGGGTIDDAGNFTLFEKAISTVKLLDPRTRRWSVGSSLSEPRWYPGLGRLRDGDLLAFGGGQQDGTLATVGSRTATADVLDRTTLTWKRTANDMPKPGGFGPAVLLFDGRLFITWYPPQFYAPATRTFSVAPDFIQALRNTPADGHDGCSVATTPENQPGEPLISDHPDHSAIVHTDGRVVTIGIWDRAMAQPGGSMVEIFDSKKNQWSLGKSNPAIIRAHPEVVQLPDGHILVAAGKYEGGGPRPAGTNEWCYTPVADLYDVDQDRWRAVAPMNKAREYHALTVLLPDARVLSIAGIAQPGNNPTVEQSRDNIEAYSPPYLFRGVRPRIDTLAKTVFARGDAVELTVSFTRSATRLRLIGLSAVTHFLDSGIPRLLDLAATQTGQTVTARLPTDPNLAMAGHYILFVMVDDIPSIGRIIQIAP